MLVDNFVASSAIIAAVALVSALVGFWDAEAAGRHPTRGSLAVGARWGVVAVVAGAGAVLAYGWLDSLLPGRAVPIYVCAGLGAALVLSAAAILIRPRLLHSAREAIALNVVWGVAFGVAIPLLLQ